jgi:N-acetylglucosamine kinase-like BadF-type ATPase
VFDAAKEGDAIAKQIITSAATQLAANILV